jgi:hypothetical protein
MTAKTMIRAMTPTVTPRMEINVTREIKAFFRLDFKYRYPINSS